MKTVYIVDAGGPFGLGHLMRSRVLAGELAARGTVPEL